MKQKNFIFQCMVAIINERNSVVNKEQAHLEKHYDFDCENIMKEKES